MAERLLFLGLGYLLGMATTLLAMVIGMAMKDRRPPPPSKVRNRVWVGHVSRN